MDESDGLENRYASHFCHQRLGPMKEAPSFEGAFLVSATPSIGTAWGVGTGDGGGTAAEAGRYPGPQLHDGGGPFLLVLF